MGQIMLNGNAYAGGSNGAYIEELGYEHIVGIGIDGQPIYETTLEIASATISQDGSYTVDSSFAGNSIISYSGYNLSGTTVYALPDGRIRLMIENGALKLKSINGGTWSGYFHITIRYTKPVT